jgi:hypothetical protein
LKREIYTIDFKEKVIIKGGEMFPHSNKRVVKRGKLKCPSPSHVWK